VKIDTLEYSRMKAIVVSVRLRIYLFALKNTNSRPLRLLTLIDYFDKKKLQSIDSSSELTTSL